MDVGFAEIHRWFNVYALTIQCSTKQVMIWVRHKLTSFPMTQCMSYEHCNSTMLFDNENLYFEYFPTNTFSLLRSSLICEENFLNGHEICSGFTDHEIEEVSENVKISQIDLNHSTYQL